MMLMLLLSELTRLGVQLLAEDDGLHIQAPAGALTDELRQAMTEQKAGLLGFARFPYVETIDGLGVLTGHIQEAFHHKIGVTSLSERSEQVPKGISYPVDAAQKLIPF